MTQSVCSAMSATDLHVQGLEALMHEPFRPCRMVHQGRTNLISNGSWFSIAGRSKRLRASVSTCLLQIQHTIFHNGGSATISQWASAVPTELKRRPQEVAREGNSRVVTRLNTLTFSLVLKPVSCGCIVWQSVRLRRTCPTARDSNGPP